MPAEIRHIVFRQVEAVAAVRDYRRRVGRPLPTGYLTHFQVEDPGPEAGGVRAVFEISPDDDSAPRPNAIGGAELAAALILFCADHKIPLPAGKRRSKNLAIGWRWS